MDEFNIHGDEAALEKVIGRTGGATVMPAETPRSLGGWAGVSTQCKTSTGEGVPALRPIIEENLKFRLKNGNFNHTNLPADRMINQAVAMNELITKSDDTLVFGYSGRCLYVDASHLTQSFADDDEVPHDRVTDASIVQELVLSNSSRPKRHLVRSIEHVTKVLQRLRRHTPSPDFDWRLPRSKDVDVFRTHKVDFTSEDFFEVVEQVKKTIRY